MITQPNQYTLNEDGVTYGLHTFKDGVNPTMICQLHPSGEWITLAPPTERQLKHFVDHGTKVTPVIEKKNSKTVSEQEQTTDPVTYPVTD